MLVFKELNNMHLSFLIFPLHSVAHNLCRWISFMLMSI